MILKFCFFHFVQQLPQLEWIKNCLSFFTKKEANVDVNACSADEYIYYLRRQVLFVIKNNSEIFERQYAW